MKVRESHMPEEELWATFFEPEKLLHTLGVDPTVHDVVEFGSGYGTFTLAAARIISGTVYAFDIETELIEVLRTRCHTEGIDNIHAEVRDFLSDGTGLSSNSIDVCLLFNILHHSDPISLMKEPYASSGREVGFRLSIGTMTPLYREVHPWKSDHGPSSV